jgi:hypothetical protein
LGLFTRRRLARSAKKAFQRLPAGEREVALRANELVKLLGLTMSETAGFYAELKPDGQELDADHKAKVRQRAELIAQCLRTLEADRDILDAVTADGERVGQDADLQPTVSVLRVLQRSLIVAASEDPGRRARAIPIPEARRLVLGVWTFWTSMPEGDLSEIAAQEDGRPG